MVFKASALCTINAKVGASFQEPNFKSISVENLLPDVAVVVQVVSQRKWNIQKFRAKPFPLPRNKASTCLSGSEGFGPWKAVGRLNLSYMMDSLFCAASRALRPLPNFPLATHSARRRLLLVPTAFGPLRRDDKQRRLFTSDSGLRASPPGSHLGINPPSTIPTSYFSGRPSLPANTIIRFVPQQTAWIVERMGKFNRILQPGLAILIPFLDRIAYVKSLKEVAIEIPSQSAITADNVTLELDGVLYTRVFDAYKAR